MVQLVTNNGLYSIINPQFSILESLLSFADTVYYIKTSVYYNPDKYYYIPDDKEVTVSNNPTVKRIVSFEVVKNTN